MKEEWKDIIGYEDLYKISSTGRVFSKRTQRLITPQSVNGKSYLRAFLSRNGQQNKVPVHRLVYTHFVGLIPTGLEIDHIDENPTNNNVGNLRCVSKVENQYNRSKTKKNKLMRVHFNGHTYGYDLVVGGVKRKKFGFRTQELAFVESQKVRESIAKEIGLFIH